MFYLKAGNQMGVPKAGMADELEKCADSMHLSTSKYCKVILTEWMKSGKKLKLQEG